MEIKDDFKLWRHYDEKEQSLWTSIPNYLIYAMLQGLYTLIELRIILFICRMTYGFRREESNYLGLEDFEKQTGISKTHLSKTIKKMLESYTLFRHSKSGNKYKYAINTLPHSVPMKHYRIGTANSELDDGFYTIGCIDYELRNLKDSGKDVILYSKKGYNTSKKAYINKDINKDIKKNINIDTNKDNLASKTEKDFPDSKYSYQEIENKKKLLISSFREEIEKNNSVDTLVKYMEEIEKIPGQEWVKIYAIYHDNFALERRDPASKATYNNNNLKILNEAQNKYLDRKRKERNR